MRPRISSGRLAASTSSASARALLLGAGWSLLPGLVLPAQAPQQPMRSLDTESGPWRTVRSGEGFRATVLGAALEIPPRDRRSVRSLAAGAAVAFDADEPVQPWAALYFWEHPRDGELLRAVVAGVQNELLLARPAGSGGGGGGEIVLTFANDTPPWASREWVDGEAIEAEELDRGSVRVGLGGGYRERVGPEQDNLAAVDLLLEPGLLWFGRGSETDPAFVVPESTFELRLHLQARFDRLERNLLELPHAGVAAGGDVTTGWRAEASDWGLPGVDFHDGDAGRDWVLATAYAYGITAVPGLGSERDRVCASLHVGAGDDVDRFSAPRVGGGPDLRGEEFETTSRPLLPGAGAGEFTPSRYAIAALGYRRELTFFAFAEVDGTVAWLDRDRQEAAGRVRRDDVLAAVSARLSSGLFGGIRVQCGYAYGFDVVRDGEQGGHELTLQMHVRF